MIIKVYFFIITGICIVSLIKSTGSKLYLPVSLICSISVIAVTLPVFDKILTFIKFSEINDGNIKSLIYIPVILIVSEYLCSICNDIGEKSLAEALTIFTRTTVIASVINLLSGIINIVKDLTG